MDTIARESLTLGLVGAGGIDTFESQRVALIQLLIFAVVLPSELLVTWLRQRLI